MTPRCKHPPCCVPAPGGEEKNILFLLVHSHSICFAFALSGQALFGL